MIAGRIHSIILGITLLSYTASCRTLVEIADPPSVTKRVSITAAYFKDMDTSFSVTKGDTIQLVASAPDEIPADPSISGLSLSNKDDSLGRGASIERTSTGISLILGDDPRLKIGGIFGASDKFGFSPSGISAGTNTVDIQDERITTIAAAFDAEYRSKKTTISDWASLGEGFNYYYLSNYLEGLISIFEATGNETYLQDLMQYADEMLADAKDLNGDGYLDYHTYYESDGKIILNKPDVQLYDWRGFRPIARLMRVLGADSSLKAKYATSYQRYSDFVRKHLVEKWSDKYSNKVLALPMYYEKEGLIHRVAHMGDILVDFYLADSSLMGLEGLSSVASGVKAQLRTGKNDSYEWNILYKDNAAIIRDYSSISGVSDVSHASGTVSFIVAEAVQTQLVFNASDLDKLVNTLLLIIRDETATDTQKWLRDFVDGGVSTVKPYSYGLVNLADGWIKLGVYNSDVQRLMDLLFSKGKTGSYRLQYLGNLAKNYQYARWY